MKPQPPETSSDPKAPKALFISLSGAQGTGTDPIVTPYDLNTEQKV